MGHYFYNAFSAHSHIRRVNMKFLSFLFLDIFVRSSKVKSWFSLNLFILTLLTTLVFQFIQCCGIKINLLYMHCTIIYTRVSIFIFWSCIEEYFNLLLGDNVLLSSFFLTENSIWSYGSASKNSLFVTAANAFYHFIVLIILIRGNLSS